MLTIDQGTRFFAQLFENLAVQESGGEECVPPYLGIAAINALADR